MNKARAKMFDMALSIVSNRHYDDLEEVTRVMGLDSFYSHQIHAYFLNEGYAKKEKIQGTRRDHYKYTITDEGYKFANSYSFVKEYDFQQKQLSKEQENKKLIEQEKQLKQSTISYNNKSIYIALIALLISAISMAITFFK